MGDKKWLDFAIDICELTKAGWTIDLSDSLLAYAYAYHKDYGTKLFSTDEEFKEWKKAQFG